MHKITPRIGPLQLDNPLLLAPMAGITSLPYRRVMKSFGAALVFTEMISANGLIRDGIKSFELLRSCPEETPLGIQLFGDEPEILAKAAEMVTDSGALLDINMGCPVKKVIRSGAGSALLKEPRRVAQILSAVRTVHKGPLSIKIRSGWDTESLNFIEIGRIAESEGVDAVTLHPRTRSQAFSGKADWQQIGELKAALNIPVFGSGDIFTAEDGLNMLQQTGCDGLMIGRGAYGNPWLFRDLLTLLRGEEITPPTRAEKRAVADSHLQLYREQFGDHKTILEMRKHLCWYARGLPGASQFRASLQQVTDMKQLLTTNRNFFCAADSQ